MSFLKKILEPRQREAWRQLCDELDALLLEKPFWALFESDKVVKWVKGWAITMDTWAKDAQGPTYTRIRAPYVNKDGFRFKIYREGYLSEVRKQFGMQDIEVSYPDFDRDFIIKANDESKVRTLLADPRIRQLIQSQPDF